MRASLALVISVLFAACEGPGAAKPGAEQANRPPFGIDVRLTAIEDVPLVLPLPQFSDPDGNQLKTLIITTLPNAGTLQLDGAAVGKTEISIASAARLTFVPAPNASGSPYTSFTFQVRDDGGGSDLDLEPNRVTIDVLANNDPPEGADFSVQTVVGVARDITVFEGTDPNDTPANIITSAVITSLPEHGLLTAEGQPVTLGQAVTSVRFTPEGSLSSSFTFQARDNGGVGSGGTDLDPTPNTVTITVIEPNLPPTSADGTATVLEDVAYTLKIADLGFSDTRHQLLFLNVESLPLSGVLLNAGLPVSLGEAVPAMDIAAGLVTYLPPPNQSGSAFASFVFLVQDDGGIAGGGKDTALAPNTLTFDVLPVNDAPLGGDRTILLSEDQADVALSAASFGFVDPRDTPANAFASVTFLSVPASGSLRHMGVPVTAGQTVAAPFTGLTYRLAANATGNVSFSFLVRDDGGTANGGIDTDVTPRTVTFSIAAANDPPSGTDATITVAEDTPRVLTATDFGFDDSADAPPNTLQDVTIVSAPGPTLQFMGSQVGNGSVIPAAALAAGLLVYTPPANAYGTALTSFSFLLRDNGGGTNQDTSLNTITFNVTSVNDAPSGANTTLTFNEDTAYTFAPGNFGFSDTNDVPPNGFAGIVIEAVPSGGVLRVGATTLVPGNVVADVTQLQFVPTENGRGTPYSVFTFQVRDDAGGTDATPNIITFNVNNVADPPVGQDNAVNTPEDTPYVFVAADFGMSDDNDTPANTITGLFVDTVPDVGALLLVSTPVSAGTFIPLGSLSSLSYVPPLNATSTPPNPLTTFTFSAVDDGALGSNRDLSPNTMRLFVGVVNDPPTDIQLSSADVTNTVRVNATSLAAGATIGTLTTTDSDAPNDVANYSLVAGTGATDNALFGITGATLQTVSALPSGAYSIRVRVDDGGGGRYEEAFSIVLRRAPTDISLTMSTVFENSAPGAVGALGATDPDPGETFNFALISGCAGGDANNAEFQITGTQLATTATFNFEATPTRSICVRVTDSNGLTLDETFVIGITNINDAPTSANKTITLNEDATYTFSAADFAVLDADGHTLTSVIVVSLPMRGTLSAGGIPVTSGQEVTPAQLTYTPVLNESLAAYASFSFRVRDNGGTANGGVDLAAAANTITFNVEAVNDAPIANAISRSVHTNMPIVITLNLFSNGMGDVSDPDNDGPTFTLTSVDASACSSALVSGLQSTGTFTFSPPPGFTGTCTLTYRVSDGALESAPGNLTLTIAGPVIWFVSQGANPANTGILGSPFPTLAAVSAVHAADHSVFVSAGTYSDAFALTANERLRGDRTSASTFDVLFSISPPSGTLARPVLNGAPPTLQNTITLASGSLMSSFAATTLAAMGVSGALVSGASVSGAVMISNNTGPVSFTNVDITSANPTALSIVGGSGTVTFDAASDIITTSGGISIQNQSGEVRFEAPVNISSASNIGVALADNAGGSVVFAGGLVITSTTGTGLLSDAAIDAPAAGGTLTVHADRGGTPLVNTITSSAGAAIAFHNTTVGPSGITWNSVNAANMTGTGISIGNTAGARFAIDGGTVSSITGSGVELAQAVNVRLANVHIQDASGSGILADQLAGNAVIQDLLIDGVIGSGVVIGASGALELDVTDNDLRGSENTAMTLQITGGAVHARLVDNRIGQIGVTGSGSQTESGIAVDVTASGAAVLVSGNTIHQVANAGLLVTLGAGFDGTFTNNTVDTLNGLSSPGMQIISGLAMGDAFSACIDVNTNTASSTGAAAGITLEQAYSTTVALPGYDGLATVPAYLLVRNPGTSTSAATGAGFVVGPSGCVQP
jgi:hypothetical protein